MFKFYDIALSTVLLSFLCVLSLTPEMMLHSGIEWTFIHLDAKHGTHSLNPVETYSISLKWFLYYFNKVLAPVILIIIFGVIKPNMSLYRGLNLSWMWIVYYTLIMISFTLDYEKLPFRFILDGFVIFIQFSYLIYCVNKDLK